MRPKISRFSLLRLSLIAGSALVAPGLAAAQDAPAAAASDPAASAPADADAATAAANQIVVTGFRQSLQAAINMKRDSVSAVDAIIAEDIAKFPDQNLAESLQRIPGIAVNRDGGEGREITVRGLSGQFTSVRVNGMMAQATTFNAGSGGGVNNNRSFDFNQFASELFRNLVVHKTAEASLDEGSLGAVVDLNTGHPLGAKTGLHGALSVVGSYNDLSKDLGPKISGLLNWKSADGTLGINVSAAYSHTKALELGNNTTRWAQAPFNSVTVNGVTTNCWNKVQDKSAAAKTYVYVQSAPCDAAALAFHPRIPRYGNITHDRERQGYTAAIEWQPSDRTHVEIDGLYSRYHEIRTEQWAEILFRNDEAGINVTDPVYDGSGNMIGGTFSGSTVSSNTSRPVTYFQRNENYYQDQRDTFWQASGKWDQQFGDTLKASLSGGMSKSIQATPIATTIIIDNPTASGYSFDYSNMASPKLTFGTDPTDPSNYILDEIRDRPTRIINQYKTAKLDLEWDVADGFKVRAGGIYRQFDFDYISGKRDSTACPKAGSPPAWGPGGITCATTASGYPLAGFPAITTDLVSLGNNGQPAGTSDQFIVADLGSGAAFSGLYARPSDPSTDPTNNRSVTEKEKGGYLQFDAKGELFNLGYALNAGIRFIATDTSSTALQATQNCTGTTCTTAGFSPITVPGHYENWLPSMNLNLFPTNDIIVRFAAAQTLTRPSLPSLSPNASVDQFNFKVSFGNPGLTPAVATNYDLGVEWYFAPQSVLAVTGFSKRVLNGTVTTVTSGPFAATGLPTSILTAGTPGYNAVNGLGGTDNWTITSIANATTPSTIKGLEFILQTPFRFLPGFLSHFGLLANLTLTDSHSTNQVTGPAATTTNGAAGTATTSAVVGGLTTPLPTVTTTTTYQGASKTMYSATLYYETDRFGARVSYSYRGPYLDNTGGSNGNLGDGYTAYKSLDASVRLSVLPNVDLTLEGSNLLDQYTYHWTDINSQRNYESFHTGRTILFGARVKM